MCYFNEDGAHNLEPERAQGDEITAINFVGVSLLFYYSKHRRTEREWEWEAGHKFSNMDLFDCMPHFADDDDDDDTTESEMKVKLKELILLESLHILVSRD